MNFYNEHFYKEFDDFIKKIEISNSFLRIKTNFGFRDIEVQKRLVQIIANKTSYEFSNLYKKHNKIEGNYKYKSEYLLCLSGIIINLKDNTVNITIKSFISNLINTLIHFLHQSYGIIKILFVKKRKINLNYSIMLDAGTIDFSDDKQITSFVAFCENGPIPILNYDFKIIHSNIKQKNFRNKFIISENPLITVLNDSRINKFEIFRLLIITIIYFIKILIKSIHKPLFSLISNDFIKVPIIFYLNKKNILNNIILTTSSIHSQPIWVRPFIGRNFKSHFINYSNNSSPFIFKDNPFTYYYPFLRHIQVDEQWVWDFEQEKMYIDNGHIGKVNITGPILFYLQNLYKSHNTSSRIKIAVFDIRPVLPEIIDRMAGTYYYFTTDVVIKFIEDILEVVQNISKRYTIDIEVVLKNKRSFVKKLHDEEYLSKINTLKKVYNNLRFSSSEENLFSLISDCNGTITIPYTSVAFVTAFLGVPSIFYDPTGNLIMPEKTGITNINTKNELYTTITKLICKINNP
jgi:polysaccharide biosynthesis PFTS motif protein